MTKIMRSAGVAAAAFSLTFAIVATMAQPAAARDLTVTATAATERNFERLSTAGMDLSRDDDRRWLDAQIRSASRRVCDSQPADKAVGTDQRCRQQARAAANIQVARLVDRAQALAAAGLPARIETMVAVIAPESE